MTRSFLIVYSNLGLGGIPKRIVDIVNEMETSFPATTIYILLKERRNFDLRATITNPRVIVTDFYQWSHADNPLLFMLWTWTHIFILNPDVILSFISPYALTILASKILFFWRKTKYIINEGHFTSTMIRSMLLPGLQRLGIKILYPIADVIITPTKAIKNDLTLSYHLPKNKTKIIQNWSTYAKSPLPKIKRVYDLIYIGRLDKTKNLLPLLKTVSDVIKHHAPHLTCLLVGDGPDKTSCVTYINTHGLDKNIRVLPPVLDISVYLKKTKVFIFNPDMKTEGFPVAVLDAMACGSVVITKIFNGVDAVINNKNGYIVTTDQEMKKRILYVLTHYNLHLPIIKSAKLRVSSFNSLDNIHAYLRYLS